MRGAVQWWPGEGCRGGPWVHPLTWKRRGRRKRDDEEGEGIQCCQCTSMPGQCLGGVMAELTGGVPGHSWVLQWLFSVGLQHSAQYTRQVCGGLEHRLTH